MKKDNKPSVKKHPTVGQLLVIFLKGSKLYFAAAIALNIMAIGGNFLMPLTVGYTIDHAIGQAPDAPINKFVEILLNVMRRFVPGGNELLICGISIGAIALVNALLQFAFRCELANASEKFAKTARDTMYSQVMKLPFKWHTENQTGDIIQRCTSDVQTTRNFVANQIVSVLRTLLTAAMALFVLYSISVTLAAIVSALFPVIALTSYFFARRIARDFKAADEAEGELTVAVQENLTGVRVVRAFGREKHEIEKFDKKNDKYTDMWIKFSRTMGLFWGSGDLSSGVVMLIVILIGTVLTINGHMSLGQMTVFITTTQQVTWPVRNLGRTIADMSKAGVSLKRLCEIMEPAPETEDGASLKPDMTGDIVFRDVEFSYKEKQSVLSGVNLVIPGGSTVGILGATGSGKSTITYLLTRLFELGDGCGSITVGDVDIRKIDRFHLRENIGLVMQEPFLYSKTVSENIAITQDEIELEKVRRKAETASIDEDIMSFEKGYETIIGERGVTLSGGQKQRVAIARTLMKESPVMIFDDSMSALDMETDKRIRDGLRAATGSATVIIISHRVATLMTADYIAVIEDGKVAEYGTHDELVALGGRYKRVYDIQAGV